VPVETTGPTRLIIRFSNGNDSEPLPSNYHTQRSWVTSTNYNPLSDPESLPLNYNPQWSWVTVIQLQPPVFLSHYNQIITANDPESLPSNYNHQFFWVTSATHLQVSCVTSMYSSSSRLLSHFDLHVLMTPLKSSSSSSRLSSGYFPRIFCNCSSSASLQRHVGPIKSYNSSININFLKSKYSSRFWVYQARDKTSFSCS
jgi:hypothetical protein